jgi:hypothetical protein
VTKGLFGGLLLFSVRTCFAPGATFLCAIVTST